ncbi:phosphodiester glycosidase family protein [Candidatus Woesebacteria bacterium]|nr:phosphodiester glycosidase family protein [Candidatus Woesebacteria bacterium]
MQKKIVLIVIFLVAFSLLTYFFKSSVSRNVTRDTSMPIPVVPVSNLKNTTDLPGGGQNYRISWFKVDDIGLLNLIPNFKEKKEFNEIAVAENCKAASNGGFYTKEDSPTGLFITGGKVMKKWEKTDFLNGVFVVDNNNKAFIGDKGPGGEVKIALETGPIIKRNSQLKVLSVANDKRARRVLVGITKAEEVYFFVIYDSTSYYLGPYLVETGKMVQMIENSLKISLRDVLNLDGGSASAFLNDGILLTEATPVGSIFCLKR